MFSLPHDGLDRRRFLQFSAAASLGLGTFAAAQAAEDKNADPFGGFILGVQSYTFRKFDLEQTLKRTQALGLHNIELYQKHAPLEASPDQIKAILKMCSDYGVKPVCWGVQAFKKDNDFNKRVFEFGKALGVPAMSADPDPDSFDSLDKLCDEYKIAIGIHPHGPQGDRLHRWYSAELIMEAVKNHNPLIGSCLDTGHLIRSAQEPFNKKLDPAQQVRVMGARNFGMHLKDHDNTRKTDVIFGKGVLDLVSVLKALREVKFKGHLSIEYEANEDEPTADVKACVEVFKEAVKKLA
jgi:sugar phosphate isomerase/epimerase